MDLRHPVAVQWRECVMLHVIGSGQLLTSRLCVIVRKDEYWRE